MSPVHVRVGQLIEHIHEKNSEIKKALQSHAMGNITDAALLRRLNELASMDLPKDPPGYAGQIIQ